MSIEHTDRESAAVAVAPRVSLADIEAAIAERYDLTGRQCAEASLIHYGVVDATSRDQNLDGQPSLRVLSICLLVMRNGFTVIGKSAPASPENFDAALGRKFAYEDAVRQLWPLMGYALRDRLAAKPEDPSPQADPTKF